MDSSSPPSFHVKHIAIIGAGPTGLAAAKYLRAQSAFDSITIFEQQEQVGGVWNYSDAAPKIYQVPQEDPFQPPDSPIVCPTSETPLFLTPMYFDLHTNIPSTLMNFSDQSFPKDTNIFPSRQDIHQYLLDYAQDVRHLIKLCFQVVSLSLVRDNGKDSWRLRAQSTTDARVIDTIYDAVVIANGHYNLHFIPEIKNIKSFQEAHPTIITHSKQYRKADAFNGKKTIIVGNGPSGLDIAFQVNQTSKGKTLLSTRTATPADKLAHTACEEVPEIEEFLVEERGVRFKNGRVETEVDLIMFCTGFLFSYPFLHDLQRQLLSTGLGLHGLYQHLFCIRYPTLVFPVVALKVVPWPLAEAQAAVVAGVWSNNLKLPAVQEMQDWSKQLEIYKGQSLHLMDLFEDGLYMNSLHDWAVQANHLVKKPPRWNDEHFWIRGLYKEAKMLFEQQGGAAKSLAELGLIYSPEQSHGLS
ncbi:hypothetical protein CDD82_7140 [Ophiocordyceps australis]|uniref:FAD/NAD(P)-binding domain-containing protein n=1 Tax=Ophiocordyceps australis TaxID=1399860 RepID=A0A2C5Y2D6_9HYPO|nr:hypothetical protein CDD82_7140 [Ophiocordyceps australis]